MPGKWNAVPFEIMDRIFDYIKEDPAHHALSFKEYQLVCQSWNRAAQKALYQDVCLNKDTLQNFVITIDKINVSLGDLVKKITFGSVFANLHDTDIIIEVIINRCPKIVEIYTADEDVRKIVWAYLASGRSQLKHLQSFNRHDVQVDTIIPLYASVAPGNETITHPHVSMNNSDSALLKHLRVAYFRSNQLEDLDSMTDDCCEPVSNLAFDSLSWAPALGAIQNLQLAVDVSILAPLEKYDICIHLNKLERAMHRSRQDKSTGCKTLTVFANNAPEDIYYASKLKLTKTRDTLELLLHLSNVVDELNHDGVHEALSLYSPNRINIIAENMDAFYAQCTIILPPWLPNDKKSKHFIPEAFTYKIGCLLARTCNQRNWCSFNAATRLIDQTRDSYVHLDRMVFCGDAPKEFRPNLNITELRLTNSIIQHKIFPDLSERLPVIKTLIIDTCSILMQEQRKLDIFLPYTTLSSFHLKIAPFINATACQRGPSQTSNFENEDLLSAANDDGFLMFKIQLDAGFYTIIKKGTEIFPIFGVKYERMLSSPHNVFLIHIKCKDMSEFVLESESKTYLIWKKRQVSRSASI